MKVIGISLLVAMSINITGCATGPHLYQGNPKPPEELGKISTMGYQRNAGVVIKKVNGKAWDNGYFFYLLPGAHTLELKVNTAPSAGAGGIAWREATLTISSNIEPGHTYIPEVDVVDGKIRARMQDGGIGFPDACMPARIAESRYEGAFSTSNKAGKSCDRYIPALNNIR